MLLQSRSLGREQHALPLNQRIRLKARRALSPSVLAQYHASSSGLVSTPHSGYHYDGSPRRFFEGWYWKVTIPDESKAVKDSFALIYSVEDPAGGSLQGGVGVQLMGPNDTYICQFSRDTNCFWADRNKLALGAALRSRGGVVPRSMTSPVRHNNKGFAWAHVHAAFIHAHTQLAQLLCHRQSSAALWSMASRHRPCCSRALSSPMRQAQQVGMCLKAQFGTHSHTYL